MSIFGLFIIMIMMMTPDVQNSRLPSSSLPKTECQDMDIGEDIEIDELPESLNGRIFIPFYLKFIGKKNHISDGSGKSFVVRLGYRGKHWTPAYFVKINVERGVSIGKISQNNEEEVLESLDIYKTVSFNGKYKGFFIRLKVRSGYTAISLHAAGYDGGEINEAILHFRDERDPMPNLNSFSMSVVGGSGFIARLKMDCRAKLGSNCIHSTDCITDGAECRGEGDMAFCDCGDQYIKKGNQCDANPISVGDPCTTSRDCSRRFAKCRRISKNRSDSPKVCQCQPGYEIDELGNCVDIKSTDNVEFVSLRRSPTFADKFPGRLPVNRHKNLTNGCALQMKSSVKDAQLFTLPWTASGFVIPFRIGLLSKSLSLFVSSGNDEIFCQVTLSLLQNEIVLRTRKRAVRKSLFIATSYWLAFDCKLHEKECELQFGSVSLDPKLNPYMKITVSNNPIESRERPIVYGFLGDGLSIKTGCVSGYNERCAHDSECRQTMNERRDKLICSKEEKCICIGTTCY